MLGGDDWSSICTVYHLCVAPNHFCTLEYIRDSYPFVLQMLMWEHSGLFIGRVLDLRWRGHRFETHRHHCIVSLSKTH